MVRENRLRLGLLLGLLSAFLVLGYVGVVTSGERPAVDDGVLFPPDHAVLLSGSFDVICKADQDVLEVDGRPRAWESFEPPVRVAHVRLPPGVHELRIGDRQRELVVALNEDEHDGPQSWTIYRRHPMNAKEERCGDCHETGEQDEQIRVGELKSYKACLECHGEVEFEATLSHPLEPLEPCQMCHALHGSTRKALLKAPAKKLCDDCHDS